MTGRKSLKREINIFYSVLIGAIISALSMLVFSAIATAIANMTNDPLSALPTASFISLTVSAAASGFIISKRASQAKMLTAALSALLLCLMLLLIGLALSGGALSGKVFLNYVSYIGVCLVFAKLGAKKKRFR